MSIVKQTYGRPAVGLVSRIPRTQKVIKRTQCLLPRQTPSFPHQRNVQQLPLPKYRDTHIWGQTPHPLKKEMEPPINKHPFSSTVTTPRPACNLH